MRSWVKLLPFILLEKIYTKMIAPNYVTIGSVKCRAWSLGNTTLLIKEIREQ